MATSSARHTQPTSLASLTRTSSPSFHPPRLRMPWSLLLFLTCLASTTLAQSDTWAPDLTSSASLASQASVSVPHETLVTADWNELRNELRRRKEDSEKDSTSETAKDGDKTKESDSKKVSKTTLTISIEQTASTAAAATSALPEAFDGNIATEFTSTSGSKCPAFLNNLLASPSYEACYPLSMLIQTSRGFFDSQKQLLSIVRVLDATCAANVTYCTDYLSTAAQNLTAEENCKSEWNKGDATVKQVLFGLKAYEMMYKASCLQTPSDDMYCFANAVTNLTTPSDAYFYYLPYNLSLPGSSVPSCSWCIEETMAIFHAASADRSQYIANTYEDAARQVNTICGPEFVNTTLPKEETAAGSSIVPSSVGMVITILGAILFSSIL
ncbi:Fc.00g111410.m01.CDS01 [Cosmosporella sp. VM-42]